MARSLKSHPEPRMRELREKRSQVRADLEQVSSTVRDARKGLERILGRERLARLALELQCEGEPLETIAADAERWQRQIAAGEPRISALGEADQVLAREQLLVVDENVAFYAERATSASEEAEAAVASALQSIGNAQEAWRKADIGWQVVRASRMRRGVGESPHVPAPDFGQVVFRLSQITERAPWPGGARPGVGVTTASLGGTQAT